VDLHVCGLSVGVGIGRVRNSENTSFRIRLREMGRVRISEKVNCHICSGRNWPCPEVRKGELSRLLGWILTKNDGDFTHRRMQTGRCKIQSGNDNKKADPPDGSLCGVDTT